MGTACHGVPGIQIPLKKNWISHDFAWFPSLSGLSCVLRLGDAPPAGVPFGLRLLKQIITNWWGTIMFTNAASVWSTNKFMAHHGSIFQNLWALSNQTGTLVLPHVRATVARRPGRLQVQDPQSTAFPCSKFPAFTSDWICSLRSASDL